MSCDLVFSGADGRGGYVETDPTDPVTVYGQTMVAGEEAIVAADPAACILRISLPMGVSFNGHAGAIDWIASRFKKSRPATLYFDEIRTPTYTDCLNRLCETMLAGDLRGIYHAGGRRRLSLYEIAQIINRVGGYDPDCLMGIPRRQAGPDSAAGRQRVHGLQQAHRAPWAATRSTPGPTAMSLVPTHADWHRERPRGEPRSPEQLHRVLATNPKIAAEAA